MLSAHIARLNILATALLVGLAPLATAAALAPATIDGRVLGLDGKPLAGVQIWLTSEPYSEKRDFRTRTKADGRFSLVRVPSGKYSFSIVRIQSADDFTESVHTRPGDTLQIDQNLKRRIVTIRNGSLVRRFEYLGSRSEGLAGGSWTETTHGLAKGVRECAELRSHPTITSRSGVVSCAKHHIPLLTVRGYGVEDYAQGRHRTITLIHTFGKQLEREQCNPNYIPRDKSLKRSKDYPVPVSVTYCPKCEEATWLTEAEAREEARHNE
jgi:hypothetical protein